MPLVTIIQTFEKSIKNANRLKHCCKWAQTSGWNTSL